MHFTDLWIIIIIIIIIIIMENEPSESDVLLAEDYWLICT